MTTIDSVVRDLMNYFAGVGAAGDRTFSIRDFDTHVMMNAYAPQDRECLGLALAALSEAGIVSPASPTEYCLTAKGLRDLRMMRDARS
jgi:hypothetical protein